jgi:hypothetical protein
VRVCVMRFQEIPDFNISLESGKPECADGGILIHHPAKLFGEFIIFRSILTLESSIYYLGQ